MKNPQKKLTNPLNTKNKTCSSPAKPMVIDKNLKAFETNFVCPKCGESLEYQDNSNRIVELLTEKATVNPWGKSAAK